MEKDDLKIMMVEVNAQYKIIDTKLDGINAHLAHINGSVQKHEEQIMEALTERAKNRQVQRDNFKDLDELVPKVRRLEDQQLTSRSIKKWIATSVALTGTLIGLIYTVYQLLQNAGGV